MGSFIQGISAEFLKLKATYVFWLAVLVVCFISFIVFIGHYIDVNSLANLGTDPWRRTNNTGHAILSIFMLNLYSVLLIGAGMYVENKASGWKLLYSYPKYRTTIFYTKLLTLLLIIGLTIVVLALLLLGVGYLLDWFRPEYEFAYNSPELFSNIKTMLHSFIAVLGVVGIHYFISLLFKNFLVTMAVGIVGFVLGLILGTISSPKALYCPYSYTLIVKDFQMFAIDKIGIVDYGVLNNVEVYSIICFIFFIVLANILESRKNIVG